MRLPLAIVIWFWASLAQAGAWPRDEGSFFISISADQTRAQIYAEYGMRGDWTMGMEVTQPQGRRLPDVTSFVHHPIWRGKGDTILSAGLAMEMRETDAVWAFPELAGVEEVAVRAGLFWGKVFSTPLGNGWATVDAQVERLVTKDWLDAGQAYKLDGTIGLKPVDRLKLMVQAQGWRRGSSRSLRLETSAAWKIGRADLVLSPSVGVIGPKDRRLKLGVWLDF